MNRLLLALPVLLVTAGIASSQSLADVAKKEKERREENARQGHKTALEAEGVGSFGHVWWRDEDVTTPMDGAQSAQPAPDDGAPLATSGPEAAHDETSMEGSTLSKRGNLPLRKNSPRRLRRR